MVRFNIKGDALWQRMNRAVEKVQERLEKTARTLESAKIPYAIVGGNAVRAWVAQVDESAVRTTRDVDILLRRSDLPAAIEAMEAAGFVYRQVASLGNASKIDMFLDGPKAKVRDAVHVLFAEERVSKDDLICSPAVEEAEEVDAYRTISLAALVKMKLNSFRDKDRTHLRDMLEVELIDEHWTNKLPPELAARLQQLIDTPGG